MIKIILVFALIVAVAVAVALALYWRSEALFWKYSAHQYRDMILRGPR